MGRVVLCATCTSDSGSNGYSGGPAPVHVGLCGRCPCAGFVWTNGYYRWHGGRYVAVGDGYSTEDTGNDEVFVLGASALTLKVARRLQKHSIKLARRQNVPLHESQPAQRHAGVRTAMPARSSVLALKNRLARRGDGQQTVLVLVIEKTRNVGLRQAVLYSLPGSAQVAGTEDALVGADNDVVTGGDDQASQALHARRQPPRLAPRHPAIPGDHNASGGAQRDQV